jgi:xanthine dehydrogenase YagT iron-sulfur-binding subunit
MGDKTPSKDGRRGVTRRRLFKTAGMTAAAGALIGPARALAQDAGKDGATVGPDPVRVKLRVNGTDFPIAAEPRRTLLDAIREDVKLTGCKRVCDRGTCGACTVWFDGKPVYSCAILAIEAEGHDIKTVEGLGTPDSMHAVQAAFARHDALQCGYCTPGLVMSTAWAVETHGKSMTREQLLDATSGNLCRCGTYAHVIQAGLDAAKRGG